MITLLACLLSVMTLRAQDVKTESKQTEEAPAAPARDLKGVVVKASRIIDKPDGKIILPSAAQTEHSANVYQLLSMMPMPGLRVNAIARTVSPVVPDGGVQIRIDGIIASANDLAALDPKRVKRIEYIDNPGVRYGDGVKYVVIIRTRCDRQGYDLGLDATNALTDLQGSNTVYGNYNMGDSQLKLSYNFGYQDLKYAREKQIADYTLCDNTVERVTRDDVERRDRSHGHNIQFTYNLADTLDNVFQASLCTTLSRSPRQQNVKLITTQSFQPGAPAPVSQTATQVSKARSASPSLDLYLYRKFGSHQSLTANATTTYISSDNYSSYDELTPYAYWVDGSTWSLWSEAIYTNRLRPFTLSAGANYQQKYVDNTYTGDVESENKTITSQIYLFSQMSGKLWHLSYTAGLGYNNLHYRQAAHNYDFHFFRPTFVLSWKIDKHFTFGYAFEASQWISRVAMVSDTRIRQNAREWKVGNPDLHQPKKLEHTWKLSYSAPAFHNSLKAYYRRNPHCNMALYTRTADDQFLYTQTNQRAINLIYLTDAAQWTVVRDRFIINANAGIFRCFNYGDLYKHHYTSYTGGIDAQLFLGPWSFMGSFDGGWRWLEGETKGNNDASLSLMAGYKYKDWNFSLSCQNPFCSNPRMYKSELINRYLHKTDQLHSRSYGQMVSLTVSCHLSGGKRYREVSRKVDHKADTDTGIIR